MSQESLLALVLLSPENSTARQVDFNEVIISFAKNKLSNFKVGPCVFFFKELIVFTEEYFNYALGLCLYTDGRFWKS